jgi:hypothetical protein
MNAPTGSEEKHRRSSTDNRRRGGRHPLSIPATLSAQTPADPPVPDLLVKIVQMSVGGVGLLADRTLELGAIYVVTAFDSLVPAGMQVRVVSVRAGEMPATFVIGAEVV